MNGPSSRRSFLRGLTALSTGSIVLAAPAVLAAAPSPDADLIRLGADLDKALAGFLTLCERKARRVAQFETIKPEIQPEIVRPRVTGPAGWHFHGEAPPNADGEPCHRQFDHRVMILWPWEAVQNTNRYHDGRTRICKHHRRLRASCEAYHAAHLAAREAAGIPIVEDARFHSGRDVMRIAFDIAAMDAATIPGLAVKGRAGLAMQQVWSSDRGGSSIDPSYRKLLQNLVALDGREAKEEA